MLAALLWYALCVAVLICGMTAEVPVPADAHDKFLYRIGAIIIFLWLLSPALFLSDSKMRSYLPLFRRRQFGFSMLGMMIAFVFFAYLFASLESLHSAAYQEEFGAYIQSAYQTFIDAGKLTGR